MGGFMNSYVSKLMYLVILSFFYSEVIWSDTNFTFSESGVNDNPSDWLGLDESQVFYKKLSHEEKDNSWVIMIGKGGQLYSIKTPELGELIAFQRTKYGQWIEEVVSAHDSNATTKIQTPD